MDPRLNEWDDGILGRTMFSPSVYGACEPFKLIKCHVHAIYGWQSLIYRGLCGLDLLSSRGTLYLPYH